MALLDKTYAGIQAILPQHLLSRLVHALMRIRFTPIKNAQIAIVGGLAGVDWSESKHQSASDFETFNDFFTRELARGARPLAPDPQSLVSPCDGRISQCGRITNDRILQAKGHHYTIRALLANDPAAAEFNNGFFHTIYLAPRDYHRVHMPMDGWLQRTIHVPGRLFSVSPATVRGVPDLFARNERVVCIFESSHGPLALVLVGAMLVSSMETVWAGTITPPYGREIVHGDWSRRDIRLQRGEEMGRFNMGSTVIMLLPPSTISALDNYGPDDIVLMGQKLARLR
jgi:phosphatidylserine decarboxylase